MGSKATIIAFSVLSLVTADQAAADNAGAAFVGGLIGGAVGSAISNSQRKSYSGTRQPRNRGTAAKPRPTSGVAAAPWQYIPFGAGAMAASNGQGLTFTSDDAGSPVLIIQPNSFVPPSALDTFVPVNVVIDGKMFGILQARVEQVGLVVSDVQVSGLEQALKPAHEAIVTSAFSTLTVSLSGFTKTVQQLAMFRQQKAMIAASTPAPAPSTTVVNVAVNGPQVPPAETEAEEPPPTTKTAVLETNVRVEIDDPDAVNKRIGELRVEIDILNKLIAEQKQQSQDSPAEPEDHEFTEETIAAIEAQLALRRKEYDEKYQKFDQYITSVRPNDKDLYMTARKASQSYPKVPYYIPGTTEQGAFWIEPKVTKVGDLMFNFRLIDPAAENDTTRDLIELDVDQLEKVRDALVKLRKNSKVAHENKVRKNYAKRLVCFPETDCPEERQNGEKGKSSTEVIFQIYEDGSTAGRIQLNKGAFQDGVNFSIESALLLQAYLKHVIREAKLEFKSGTQTQKELDQMFQ